jgi:uncharacterized membrane protein YidH (DUF202 family)
MNPKTLFGELRRRNVLKVATAYAAIAWLLIESTSLWLSAVGAPTGVIRGIVVLVALGFVLIVYISWAFEATPQGMKRTRNVAPDAVLPTWSRRKFAAFIIAVTVLAASLHLLHFLRNKPAPPGPVAASEARP